MRIMCVDDEEIIREGLRTLIDWKAAGFDEWAEAPHAARAIELIRLQPPDLIITDIYMPVMSGIEFARTVRAEHPGIRFIILTGHEKFECAQEAIEIGVARYMVKPIFPEELQEAVSAVVDEIISERTANKWSEQAKQRLREYKPVITEQFWVELLSGSLRGEEAIRARMQQLDIELYAESLSCVVIKLDMHAIATRYGRHNMNLIKFAVRNITEEIMHEKLAHIADIEPSQLHAVFRGEVNADSLAIVLRSFETTLDLNGCVGIGSAYPDVSELFHSAREAEEAAQILTMMDQTGIIGYKEIPTRKKERLDYPYAEEKTILDTLRYREEAQPNLLTPFYTALSQQRTAWPMTKLAFVQLLGSIYRVADEYDIGDSMPPFYDTYTELINAQSGTGIRELFQRLCELLVTCKNKKHSSLVNLLIDQAKAVIEERFSDSELTINSIAAQLCVTPNYLSRIFHQTTGMTCVEYLTQKRLAAAKTLLKHTRLKSYQIAEKAGYANSHYFSSLFKKNVGETPSQFRIGHGARD
ncbi:response regulator [Paenibacillus xerothermodurans]|nr:response regulator [Paenibacillus xerothermodurans]